MKLRARHTSVRVRAIDDESIDRIIRAGFAEDLAGAVRFALALARRWIDEVKAPKAASR